MGNKSIDQLLKRGSLLSNHSNEFAKLSRTDKLVCLEIMENNNGNLKAFVIYTCRQYRLQGVEIDKEELLKDLVKFQNFAAEMDNNSSA